MFELDGGGVGETLSVDEQEVLDRLDDFERSIADGSISSLPSVREQYDVYVVERNR